MAGLCWMALVLAFFLSAGNSSAAVDQNWLASIIEGIKNQYALGDTFSLAVNVPQNQDPSNLQEVFKDDPADQVKQTVSGGQVYQGARVVAAAQSGALSHVLEKIQPFIKSSEGNVLVIYSEESPCGPTCTNQDGIAGKINDVTQNWSGFAFAFSKVADVSDASQQAESFKQLEISKLGLDNIFRCYKPGDSFQCTSCSSGGDVAPSCVANNEEQGASEGTGGNVGEETGASVGEETGASVGEEIPAGIGGGAQGREGGLSKCRGRDKRGCKRRGRKGGKVRRQCKRRGGCKGKRNGKRGKGSKVRKGRKPRRGRKGGKRGKRRGGRKGGKRGKRRGGRKGSKKGKRRGRKGKRWGKSGKRRGGRRRGLQVE
ncbi:uncharacterized protein LOC118327622 [Morone saxatilis]|uniref:uncharacterized protein LOC118327622 n=1 Tax=Morone saxatilis TaxID=34816 RepID=UPI0015E23F69|nr:uncharacterized protein LOC118327622 [Morone saxatilis]XP_035516938.1 uncharacterized protein LOC118327622 [Morone saxatilis]XP_035516939.1 uncharacterized protein LOC118327622 [Morone saxatilis]XP_035516940.1 uncharacterized protein LOC118327622 [Morone saxatilis]